MEKLFDLLKAFSFLVGVGVLLHYYAFAISWGIRKGQAKVKINDINLNINNIKE